MDAINQLTKNIFSLAQAVKKGTAQENVPFISHLSGKSYIIVAERETKHTFLRFLNKTKINVYEAGGNIDEGQRKKINSPSNAEDAGLLTKSDCFFKVSINGMKPLMSCEVRDISIGKFIRSKFIRSKIQKNIPALASNPPTLNPNIAIPQKSSKSKGPLPATPPPSKPTPAKKSEANPPALASIIGPSGEEYTGRGVLDALKSDLETNPLNKYKKNPPANPMTP
ncbi:MAG: hypothetical protein LBB05_01670 [Puniceicoccales bacterium]|jgi:hypothetical protein|nr:hypothetical protein [Puniceicoccales bacterium]